MSKRTDDTDRAVASVPLAIARRGLMLVLSSPSGAGKSTIAKALLARDAMLTMSVSVTTRPPRPGEITIRSTLSATISSTVMASLRTTRSSWPSSPRYWTRL